MATTKIYLDTRAVKPGNPARLKLSICHFRSRVLIPLEAKVLPSQWDDAKGKVIKHPDQMRLNIYISRSKEKVDSLLLGLANEGVLATCTIAEIKQYIIDILNPKLAETRAREAENKKKFSYQYKEFANKHTENTMKIYMHTYSRLSAFAKENDIDLENILFEDVTREWLSNFDAYLAKTSPSQNARNVHLRNIRAVFNEAISNEVTTAYPFRRFKIKPIATRKRSLTVDELRTLFNYPVQEYARVHRDMFKLIFMLIGINAVDLCHLKEIVNGRIEYSRAKTHRLYSIKVEPEALEIINRYKGQDWLINALDRYTSHQDFIKHINKALKKIGPMRRLAGRGGKWEIEPLFPELSTYWARHSWATIAASLDIPKDTIAHALGHGNSTVTDIYIDFDQDKVDRANRKVLNWVLYKKKSASYSVPKGVSRSASKGVSHSASPIE
ncbi:phage integrase SAM-like domain-containing protein [Sodaliphilus sp.]|uniref:phage integrase SAM-like domain-containing protein n=1 Tax=Sodaliphilus sp. TaxID=2815818 RepID=UPI00388E555B